MFKNICLTSVSAIMFLGAFSTMSPSMCMDEEKVQSYLGVSSDSKEEITQPKASPHSHSGFTMGIGVKFPEEPVKSSSYSIMVRLAEKIPDLTEKEEKRKKALLRQAELLEKVKKWQEQRNHSNLEKSENEPIESDLEER